MRRTALVSALLVGAACGSSEAEVPAGADYTVAVDCDDPDRRVDLVGLQELSDITEDPLFTLEIVDGDDSKVLQVYVSLGGITLDGVELTNSSAGETLTEVGAAHLVGGLPSAEPGSFENAHLGVSLVCK